MILRMLTFFKQVLFLILRILCTILRCGRRKKVAKDDSLPTDVVIGDVPTNTYQNYSASTMTNGYEVSAPAFYQQSQQTRHSHQSQFEKPAIAEYEQDQSSDMQMDSWDQWDYQDVSQSTENNHTVPSVVTPKTESPTVEMDFFADMEPSVKVKKIFIKKKEKTSNTQRNRLALDQDLDFKTTGELDAWQDEDNGEGWVDDEVDLDEIDTEKIAREARELRKQERIQKSAEQKKLKLAKKAAQQHDHRLGMKVS